MRRLALSALLPVLVLVVGCGKKDTGPKGPFVPLVQRLPADAPLVVLADIGGLFATADRAEQDLKKLPIMTKHPELLGLIEQQLAVGRASLVMLKGKVGMDVSKDLARAAIAVMAPADGDMDLVVVVEGKFPADFFARMFPGAKPEKIAGQDVYPSPGSLKLALLEQRLLVAAAPQRMAAILSGPAGAAEKLAQRHPGLLAGGAAESLLRLSFLVPDDLGRQLEAVPGMGVFSGVQQLFVDAGHGLELAAVCRDDKTVDHVRSVFEAWAELLAGGHRLLRGLGYWLLVLDLDGLGEVDDLPPVLAPALADREGWLATLEALFPEPGGPPPVNIDGRRVSLVADSRALKGAGLLVCLGSAVALPALLGRQRNDAEAELEKALEEAQRLDGKGGAR